MGKRLINGHDFANMIEAGAKLLNANVENINDLNVFPVPDGDTGTNMSMTITSGVENIQKQPLAHIGKCAELLSKGLLMGARGNSGVILSQLFRGFAKSVQAYEQIDTLQFAAALQQGVDTAYQAVVKPVEGTILTVSRESAQHALQIAKRTNDLAELMTEVYLKAKEALAHTPELLPILKQVGVVDSGGQGLVYIYEAFVYALTGVEVSPSTRPASTGEKHVDYTPLTLSHHHADRAQAQIATEEIKYPYDMEFFILRHPYGPVFDETVFRQQLEQSGDSVIVIVDDDVVKVHVHSNAPGEVLNLALPYGELTKFHIENMRETHRHIIGDEPSEAPMSMNDGEAEASLKPYGLVSVAAGTGIIEIMESIGVDYVLTGGQTMNPSTEDLLKAINAVPAQKIFVLPNNSNIILAAEQAKELAEKEVIIIPTKTIPQGVAAVVAFQEQVSWEENQTNMLAAYSQVRSGQVTEATRDTEMDGVLIAKGDYLGIVEGKIVGSTKELLATSEQLLQALIESGEEFVTIFTGADADEMCTNQLLAYLGDKFPDVEVEVHQGDQPVYHYLFSAE